MPTENNTSQTQPEVKRWQLKGFIPGVEGESKAVFRPVVVLASDFDAAQSELVALREELDTMTAAAKGVRDAWREDQQRLNAADERADLLEGLLRKSLMAITRTLEGGRDRIMDHGGTCDSVECMMDGDPTIREIRAALKADPATPV